MTTGGAGAAGIRYQVRPGETLFGLAQRAGVSEAAIRQANPGVRGITIYAGQVLILPPRPLLPGTVRVRQGETLPKLARRLGMKA